MSAAEPTAKGAFGRWFGGGAATGNSDGRAASSGATEPRTGWFQRLKAGLGKTSSRLTEGITGLIEKRKLDAGTLDELEDVLIGADLGVETSARITRALAEGRFEKGISAADVRRVLAEEITRVLSPVARPLEVSASNRPHVILVVGVNGSGKTTTIGKIAAELAREGKESHARGRRHVSRRRHRSAQDLGRAHGRARRGSRCRAPTRRLLPTRRCARRARRPSTCSSSTLRAVFRTRRP